MLTHSSTGCFCVNHINPYYQTSKSHKSSAPTSKASLPTRSHATTRHKGKETAKPITPPFESAFEEDSDPEQAQKDKEMQKILALNAKYFKKLYKPTNNNLKTSSNTRNKNVDTTSRYKNDNQSGQFGNQRTITVAGARKTIGGHVVQQSGMQCFNCKEFGHFAKECRKPKWQSDWLADTDEEIDEQELEAHYNYMEKIQEVPNADSGTDSEPLEQTIHMLAPKCPSFNGRPTYANPMSLKKAQSEIPCLYEIPHDQSDPANNLIPDREETLTFERESREKLNKDLVKNPYDLH
ncbi:integrase, catalytic region, zinc finger, CCHC-type containing protein [Tanacetum coccineum]